MSNNVGKTAEKPDNHRAKFITLAVLLLWVAGVFTFTVLKFAKVV